MTVTEYFKQIDTMLLPKSEEDAINQLIESHRYLRQKNWDNNVIQCKFWSEPKWKQWILKILNIKIY